MPRADDSGHTPVHPTMSCKYVLLHNNQPVQRNLSSWFSVNPRVCPTWKRGELACESVRSQQFLLVSYLSPTVSSLLGSSHYYSCRVINWGSFADIGDIGDLYLLVGPWPQRLQGAGCMVDAAARLLAWFVDGRLLAFFPGRVCPGLPLLAPSMSFSRGLYRRLDLGSLDYCS